VFFLPSVFYLALGKELLCRVPEKKHSANHVALGKEPDSGSGGPVKMMRPVVCVCVKDQLVIIVRALGGKTTVFTLPPMFSRGYAGEFELGAAKISMQVAWSIMDP
jgi:hypothetical protein